MHRTLSGWEYYVLLVEAQALCKNRLSKVYETDIRQFRLDFGKMSLIVGIGQYFYTTKNPPTAPQNPSTFAMLMRKDIGGKFLDSFKQYKNDRIYVMEFSNGHKLILEQFAQGNLFLVDSEDKIIRPYSFAPTSKKKYKVREKYEYPDSPSINLLRNSSEWKKLVMQNPKKSVGSALGRLSFGKIYVNNLLSSLGIDSDTPVSKLSSEDSARIIEGIFKMQKNPRFLILERGKDIELSLCVLEGWEIKFEFDEFSAGVQKFVSLNSSSAKEAKSPQQIRLQKRLEEQRAALLRVDNNIEKLIEFSRYIEQNMALVDEKLIEARKKGEKSMRL